MARLLIRPGAIGDFILSLPALEALRGDYTEVWCAEQNVPLARFADAAQSIVTSGLDRLGLLPADDVIDRLRSFDSIISWYGANRPEFRALVSDLRLPFAFLPALPNGSCHATDFYNDQARQLARKGPIAAPDLGKKTRALNPRSRLRFAGDYLGGAHPSSRFPKIDTPPAARTFAAIQPFASNLARRAPISVFESAAARLAQSMPVHWLCGPEEHLPNAVRIDNLYDLACWLSQARIFVGNDSGISHLAAAVGTPVHAFFRTTDPKVWSPRGPSVNPIIL